jgi:hypothetical protein
VIEIPLTQGRVAIVDDEDAHLAEFKWCVYNYRRNWYAVRRRPGGGALIRMHREIVGAPDGLQVDHVSGDSLDNRRANLRLATQAGNTQNMRMRCDNTSGYRGVCWFARDARWKAEISAFGVRRHLGYFYGVLDAARAYDAAAKELHGEFARLNFPEDKQRGRPRT